MDKKVKKIVNKVIRVEARQEAMDILELATEEQINEFIDYYNQKKENICCLILDTIKMKLIKAEKMELKKDDYFGYWFENED